MKTKCPIVLVLVFRLASQISEAALEPGVMLTTNGGGALQVNLYSTPSVVDWNNDGRRDLLVGQFYYGNVSVFTNQGPADEPCLSAGTILKSGLADLTTSYG